MTKPKNKTTTEPAASEPTPTVVKVDKGIPLPSPHERNLNKGESIHGFHLLKEITTPEKSGDSIFYPDKTMKRMTSAAANFGKRQNPKWSFAIRTVTENGVVGVRVWRTK